MFRIKMKQMAMVIGILISGVFMVPQNTDARCELDCGDVRYICPDGFDCAVIGDSLLCGDVPPTTCDPTVPGEG